MIEIFEEIFSKIRKCSADYEKGVLSGNIRDMEDYKERMGRINGLREAEAIILDLYRNLNNADFSENIND
jgi:hypothetical protein